MRQTKTTTEKPPTRDEWHVIGRGLNGWHANGINVSSSGGDIIDRPWWTGGTQYGYLSGAIEGALVYDASEANADAFSALIISGPMVNPSLAPDAVKRFADHDAAARMAPHMAGAFQTIATLASSETYSGLDYVGIAIYRRLLSAVPGMKIGTVRNSTIVWETTNT